MKVTRADKQRKVIDLHEAEPGTPLRKLDDTLEQVYIATDQGTEGQTEVIRLQDGAWFRWPDLTSVVVLNAETIVHGEVYE
mgnify:CR=1 FL=1